MAIVKLTTTDVGIGYTSTGNDTITGSSSVNDVVKVLDGANVITDSTVENVEFAHASTDFTYKSVLSGVQVLLGGAVVATVAAGEKLKFTDGSVNVDNVSGVYKLSGVTVSSSGGILDLSGVLSTGTGQISTLSSTNVSLSLTTGQDSLHGTTGNDTFQARLVDNQNTLQSGDFINGGAGVDTLKAYIGNSQKFAILAETVGVENLVIQAQAIATDSTDNNMSKTNEVQIDAQLLKGVTYFEDNNSRADLLIEDVRLDFVAKPNAVTSDVTIAMVATDPGHVDYGVYFDQPSLLAGSSSNSQLSLELMDTRSMVNGTAPLLNSPYYKFSFYLDGVLYHVGGAGAGGEAIDAAQTYPELLAAITAAVALNPALVGKVSVTLGGKFTATDTETGLSFQGDKILLTANNSGSFNDSGVGTGWEANGPVPPSSGLHTNMSTVFDSTSDLITSKIILDHVGRGNMGGDLVVGGLSVGDTDNCKGVEQFDITVIRDSELQTINSTNNKLREVYVENAANATGKLVVTGTEHTGDNFSAPSLNATANDILNQIYTVALGTLVGGGSPLSFVGELGVNTALPGTEVAIKTPTNTTGDQHNGFGFHDIRVFDANKMVGDVTITAELTDSVVAKFMNRMDNQSNPAADNAQFNYTLGHGNDNLLLAISSQNLADAGSTNREDFVLNIAGGAGNDRIVTIIESDFVPTPFDALHAVPGNRTMYGNGNGTEFWYQNSKWNANLNIDAGDGNDFVNTIGAGDFKILLGAGDDTVYTDNTGLQYYQSRAIDVSHVSAGTLVSDGWKGAQWVYNAVNTDVNNLLSEANTMTSFVTPTAADEHFYYKTQLTVTFRGLTSTVNVPNSSDFGVSDLQINQAIKDAINNNAVLNKLIVAEDGPANTLVVTSLIDGNRSEEDSSYGNLNVADLAVALTAPTNITPSDVASYNAAHPGATFADATAMAAAIAQDAGLFNTVTAAAGGKYAPEFASDTFGTVGGLDSINVSDNHVTGGTGNDVIVLGTNNFVSDGAATADDMMQASNDTVIYNAMGFGNDTIVNFVPEFANQRSGSDNAGIDYLDFTGIKGDINATGSNFTNSGAGTVTNQLDKSISLIDYESAMALTVGGIEADIASTFADSPTALSHVVVAVDNNNVGHVYQVIDAVGTGAGSITVTLAGTIDLADTNWFALSAGNFI